jgi:signal transduction histidine kinase/DNA-binding response OmpR family regulator
MFGVTLIIFLYHLLQFFYLRERVIFWFTLWLLFCTTTQAMTSGLIIGSITEYRFALQLFIATGIFYVYWFFGRVFTDSQRKYPVLDRLVLLLTSLIFLEICLVIVLLLFFGAQARMTGVGDHYIFLCAYSILGTILSIAFLTRRDQFARYFAVGSLIANIALIIGTLWSMGAIGMPLGFDPYAIGILFQIFIYSFGIVYRRRKLALQAQSEKLEAARAQAEVDRIRELDELKTRFFTNISHELRTPLTLIQGPIRQALEHGNAEDSRVEFPRKAFEMVARNTNRLHALVDELLELSRIESGAIKLSVTRGNMLGFLRVLASSFQSMAERNNIRFVLELKGEDQDAVYDAEKLEKIFSNLLSNAFKYTPDGGEVRIEGRIQDGKFVLEISDTGKGIPPEDLDSIFDRFYRVEGSEEKGSGIGLALCKELVEVQNGQISAESKTGRGTRFRVELPTRLKDLPEHAVERSEKNRVQPVLETTMSDFDATEGPGNSETKKDLPIILLVEDHPDLQDFIREGLRSKYKVLLATDGLQGERMAIEHIPDLVISDVMMPRKDGFELCHSLKNNAKTSHIPVILLTAKAGQSNKMEGLYQGADAYLTKPFDFDELRVRIENLLQAKTRLWESFKASGALLIDDLPLESLDSQFMKKVLSVIEENLDSENLNVAMLARSVGFSRAQLNRKLKALTDRSPNQLINDIRLNKAYHFLQNQTGNVSEVAYAVGFSSLSYFTKRFKTKFGCAPSEVTQASS